MATDITLRNKSADILLRDGVCPKHDIARLYTSEICESETCKTFLTTPGTEMSYENMYIHSLNRYTQPVEYLILLRAINPRDMTYISRSDPKTILNEIWQSHTVWISTTTQILAQSMCFGQSFFSPKKHQETFSPNLINIACMSFAPQEICDSFEENVNKIMFVTAISGSLDITDCFIKEAIVEDKNIIIIKMNDDDLVNHKFTEKNINGILYKFLQLSSQNVVTPNTPPRNLYTPNTPHDSPGPMGKRIKLNNETIASFSPMSDFSALSRTKLDTVFDEEFDEEHCISGKSIFTGKPSSILKNNADKLYSKFILAKDILIDSFFMMNDTTKYIGIYHDFPTKMKYETEFDCTQAIIFIIKNQHKISIDTLELLSYCNTLNVDLIEVFTEFSLDTLLWIFSVLCNCKEDSIQFDCCEILFYLINEIIKKGEKCQKDFYTCFKTSSLLALMIVNYNKFEKTSEIANVYEHLSNVCNEFKLNIDSDTIQMFINANVIE